MLLLSGWQIRAVLAECISPSDVLLGWLSPHACMQPLFSWQFHAVVAAAFRALCPTKGLVSWLVSHALVQPLVSYSGRSGQRHFGWNAIWQVLWPCVDLHAYIMGMLASVSGLGLFLCAYGAC